MSQNISYRFCDIWGKFGWSNQALRDASVGWLSTVDSVNLTRPTDKKNSSKTELNTVGWLSKVSVFKIQFAESHQMIRQLQKEKKTIETNHFKSAVKYKSVNEKCFVVLEISIEVLISINLQHSMRSRLIISIMS